MSRARAVRNARTRQSHALLCEDDRDLTGHYDKLISIEMIEAIGERNTSTTYFTQCGAPASADG